MQKYNFDKVINREGTNAVKIDGLTEFFGRNDLLPLWIADMDFEVCPEITEAVAQRISHPVYGYAAPTDSYWQSIIDWLKEWHSFDVTRDEIDYVPGVVKGVAFAVNCFTKRGDKIVIQPPVYHPFKMVIEGNERVVVNNPLIETDGFYKMDLEGLETIFREQSPKMMILCNPHNPIGITWDKETLRRVASLSVKYGVLVVSDEIHGDLAVFGYSHTPFATVSEEAAACSVTFGAPSKTFNIPGFVSSWAVIKNPELRQKFFSWLQTNEFDAPTFVATIATEAAYKNGAEWLAEAKHYIEENIRYVESYLSERLPILKIFRPQASFLVWLDCRALNMSHKELIRLFVDNAHLALNDGEMFGTEGHGFMRLNVATPRETLTKALDQLAIAIKG